MRKADAKDIIEDWLARCERMLREPRQPSTKRRRGRPPKSDANEFFRLVVGHHGTRTLAGHEGVTVRAASLRLEKIIRRWAAQHLTSAERLALNIPEGTLRSERAAFAERLRNGGK